MKTSCVVVKTFDGEIHFGVVRGSSMHWVKEYPDATIFKNVGAVEDKLWLVRPGIQKTELIVIENYGLESEKTYKPILEAKPGFAARFRFVEN